MIFVKKLIVLFWYKKYFLYWISIVYKRKKYLLLKFGWDLVDCSEYVIVYGICVVLSGLSSSMKRFFWELL